MQYFCEPSELEMALGNIEWAQYYEHALFSVLSVISCCSFLVDLIAYQQYKVLS